MSAIRKDFLPQDIEPLLRKNGFGRCVTIQSEQSEIENVFQLANARKNDFIKGIVGQIDLPGKNVRGKLSYYSQFEKLKGFRHILQGEAKKELYAATGIYKRH